MVRDWPSAPVPASSSTPPSTGPGARSCRDQGGGAGHRWDGGRADHSCTAWFLYLVLGEKKYSRSSKGCGYWGCTPYPLVTWRVAMGTTERSACGQLEGVGGQLPGHPQVVPD